MCSESSIKSQSYSTCAQQKSIIHCNTLQYTATLCSTLQHTAHCNIAGVICNVRPAKDNRALQQIAADCSRLQHTAAHCSTLQHTAAFCSTLQHTAAHCSTPQQCRGDTHVQLVTVNDSVQHTATHRNTLQHYRSMPHAALTHPNALQHFASVCKRLQHRRSDIQCEAGNSP